LEFGVWGLGLGVLGFDQGFWVSGFEFWVLGFRVWAHFRLYPGGAATPTLSLSTIHSLRFRDMVLRVQGSRF
jgi:hypothetical protein